MTAGGDKELSALARQNSGILWLSCNDWRSLGVHRQKGVPTCRITARVGSDN